MFFDFSVIVDADQKDIARIFFRAFRIYLVYPILRLCEIDKKVCILHLPVFLIYFTDDLTRIASCDHTIRNIFCYDASTSDYNIVSDGYSRHDLHTASEPHMIADGNWFSIFQPFISLRGIDRMSGSIKSTVRSDKYILPDRYRRFI